VEPMPDSPGPGGGGRAELQLSHLGSLEPDVERALAARLADVAIYPWHTGKQINWGHVVGLAGDIPGFAGCSAVFLSGPLTPNGRDYIRTQDDAVRIINVIPITEEERAQARTMAPIPFIQDLMDRVNIFTGRS